MIGPKELLLLLITWGIPTGNIKIDDSNYYVPTMKELKWAIKWSRSISHKLSMKAYSKENDCDSTSNRIDAFVEIYNDIVDSGAQDYAVGTIYYDRDWGYPHHSINIAVVKDKDGNNKPVFIENDGFETDLSSTELLSISWGEF